RFAEAFSLWQDWSFTGPLFIYSLRDVGTNPADEWQNYGVDHADGTHKAAWARLQQLLRAPQNVRGWPNTGGASVYWDAPGYDYGATITGYRVYAFPTGINVTVSASARSTTLSLPSGQSYHFVVQALQ